MVIAKIIAYWWIMAGIPVWFVFLCGILEGTDLFLKVFVHTDMGREVLQSKQFLAMK